MYWLGYAIILSGVTTYAYFMRMTPEDKTAFFKKMGM